MTAQRQRVSLQPAYLLHQYPYRDTSRLLELLTPQFGRVGLVARGVRAPGSRLRAVLQPFRPLLISWSARGDLGTMTGAEPASNPLAVPAARLNSGWYMNELLLRLTHRHDAHPALFDDYARALGELTVAQRQAPVLRIFEKRLLDTLGYGIDLALTARGQPVQASQHYAYRIEQGLTATEPGAARSYPGGSLLALDAERLDDDRVLADAQRLLHDVLGYYLGPRPLKVREVSRAMLRHKS